MPRIFISYRRNDSSAFVGRIFDRLIEHFGDQNVFRDLDKIPPGAEFAKLIAEQIFQCQVLIAVIGKDWLNAKNDGGFRRLNDPEDFVRAEIGTALTLGKLVIPCLVEGTDMPKQKQLPNEIAPLAGRNAIEISETRFDYDIGRLIQSIDPKFENTSILIESKNLKPSLLSFVPSIATLTLLVTVLFLVFADISLGWDFDGAEISLLTLIALGVSVLLSRIIARKKHHGKDK